MSVNAPINQNYQQLRPYLFSVAYRMTGSASDAEDLVQDAWIRYLDAGAPAVDSLRAYLTTIVSRLSLDYLKSARVTREHYVGTWMPEPVLTNDAIDSPEKSVEQREAISLALLTLMEHLTPDQRVVYVLREAFDFAYEEIATHLGKSAAACRQIYRRAQQRMASHQPPPSVPADERRSIVERFMAAFSRGDAKDIAGLLADDATWMNDGGPNRLVIRDAIHGRERISTVLAGFLSKVPPGLDNTARLIDLNGALAIAIFDYGNLERILALEISNGLVTSVRVLLNPEKLVHLSRALGTEPAWETPYPKPRATRSTWRGMESD